MYKFIKLSKSETCYKCFNNIKWVQILGLMHYKYWCKKCGHVWEWDVEKGYKNCNEQFSNDYNIKFV